MVVLCFHTLSPELLRWYSQLSPHCFCKSLITWDLNHWHFSLSQGSWELLRQRTFCWGQEAKAVLLRFTWDCEIVLLLVQGRAWKFITPKFYSSLTSFLSQWNVPLPNHKSNCICSKKAKPYFTLLPHASTPITREFMSDDTKSCLQSKTLGRSASLFVLYQQEEQGTGKFRLHMCVMILKWYSACSSAPLSLPLKNPFSIPAVTIPVFHMHIHSDSCPSFCSNFDQIIFKCSENTLRLRPFFSVAYLLCPDTASWPRAAVSATQFIVLHSFCLILHNWVIHCISFSKA